MAYFNVDWLDDDRLDMKEGLELNEFGQPINTPDIEGLMMDYLVEGEDILDLNMEVPTINTDETEGSYWTPGDYYAIENIEGSDTRISGSDLWSGSGAAGTLMMMDKYNQFKEKNKKRSTIANISKSLNEIEMVHQLGGSKSRAIQSVVGKSGFANSGSSDKMQKAHYGDVSRTVKGMTGNIKKSMLSYEGSVEGLRDQHIDDTWALYSDWLALDPEVASIKTIESVDVIEGSLDNSISDGDDGDSGFENDYEQVINEQIGDWDTLTDATTALGIIGGQALSGVEQDALMSICIQRPDLCPEAGSGSTEGGIDWDSFWGYEEEDSDTGGVTEDASNCYDSNGGAITPAPYGCPGYGDTSGNTLSCEEQGMCSPPWPGPCVSCSEWGSSDARIKENINYLYNSPDGHKVYAFDYKYKQYGKDRYKGVMAQEVMKKVPEAIHNINGVLHVDYSMIDVDMEIVNG